VGAGKATQQLGDFQRSLKEWISKQIEQHYDFKINLMNKHTCDPNTLAARLYEVTRLSDLEVKIKSY